MLRETADLLKGNSLREREAQASQGARWPPQPPLPRSSADAQTHTSPRTQSSPHTCRLPRGAPAWLPWLGCRAAPSGARPGPGRHWVSAGLQACARLPRFHPPACGADPARLGGGRTGRGAGPQQLRRPGASTRPVARWSTCRAEATKVDGSRASSLCPRYPSPPHVLCPPAPRSPALPDGPVPSPGLQLGAVHPLLCSVPPGGPGRRLPPPLPRSSSRGPGRGHSSSGHTVAQGRGVPGPPTAEPPASTDVLWGTHRHGRPSRYLTCCSPRAPLFPTTAGQPPSSGRWETVCSPALPPRSPGRPHTEQDKALVLLETDGGQSLDCLCRLQLEKIQGRKKTLFLEFRFTRKCILLIAFEGTN